MLFASMPKGFKKVVDKRKVVDGKERKVVDQRKR